MKRLWGIWSPKASSKNYVLGIMKNPALRDFKYRSNPPAFSRSVRLKATPCHAADADSHRRMDGLAIN